MNWSIPSISPVVWQVGQLILTVVLLVLIWTAADGPAIAQALGNAHWGWLLAAAGTLLCQTVLSAWRWKVTARALGQSLPFSHAIQEYFLSQAINQALPGAVVGDATRAVRSRSEVGLAVSGLAVGLERLAGQIALFATLACAFSVTYFLDGGLDWPPGIAGPVGGTIIIVTLAALGVAALRPHIALINQTASRWVDLAWHALLSRRVLPMQIALGATIALCNVAAFGFCVVAIGLPITLGPLFAVVPLILFSMLIPLTISGWGVREGSAALLLPIIGASVADAVAASVLFGVAMLLAVIPGLILMATK